MVARQVPAAAHRPLARTGEGLDAPLGLSTLALAGALGLAALSGVVAGLALPRGPVTTDQALALLVGGLAVGGAAGALLRSRWALLLVPALHLVAFELVRVGAVGPTVDLPRFDTAFGVLAFLLGRGVYAVLGLLPMVVGAWLGVTAVHSLAGAPVAWLPVGLGALAVAGLAAWLLVPASTPPVLGPDGLPLPGSVAELATVRLGGHDQAIMVRGRSAENPVLLYLSGGPGQSDLPFSRVLLEDLTADFVVVSWDQRGTGRSYAALAPTDTLTLEGAIADTIELAERLRARFGEEKVYLLGESWGSTLAVLAAQRRPDLFHAVIGSGQMVSQSVTDRIVWRDLLAQAQATGDWALYDRVLTLGEPPYRDVPWSNAFVMTQYGRLYQPYTPPAAYVERGTAARLGFYGVLGSEYALIDKVNVLRGLVDVFAVLYPQLQGIDFRRDVPRLEVPFYLLDGQAELRGRRDLALEWFASLEAPVKRVFSFPDAGHAVAFEQFEALHRLLVGTVLPETYPDRE
ncbi:MAG TPA: alpha/beta hydrolase [Trueperaceae bacterium]|nr:alpha/beta hydrolase [Trueperaceae bacterium]